MVSNVFVVDQDAKTLDIYLIIYVSVGTAEAYGIRLSHIFEIPSISIEIPSILIKNLGF